MIINNEIFVSGCAFMQYPVEIIESVIESERDNRTYNIMKCHPFMCEWGLGMMPNVTDTFPIKQISGIKLSYLSIVEKKIFSIEIPISFSSIIKTIESIRNYNHDLKLTDLIIGMAPHGLISLWLHGNYKSILIGTFLATEETSNHYVQKAEYSQQVIESYCEEYFMILDDVYTNILQNGIPPISYFYKLNINYCYRYLPIMGNHKDIDTKNEFNSYLFKMIGEKLTNGTFDKTESKSLLTFHESGIPLKLVIKWMYNSISYSSYFWLEEEQITFIFNRFYGAHPETKTDFIIRIDAENKKYELALYRQGLKEPVVIPESAYQLIVFKNKFEDYRSENYNQPRGAWIW